MKAIIDSIGRYAANADPRAALANFIALLIVSNQPFYPLYVYALAGDAAQATLVSFLSTPFFAAVPAVARRNSLAGRMLLCFTGTANTVLCVWAVGAATGIALFYLPCILIGTLLFSAREKAAMALCAVLPMAAYFVLRERFGAPLAVFSPADERAMIVLHAVSVGSLTAVIGYKFATLFEPKPSS